MVECYDKEEKILEGLRGLEIMMQERVRGTL